jgi:hypothetical protein
MSTSTRQATQGSTLPLARRDSTELMRSAAIVVGYVLLLWAIAIVLFYPNGWWPIWLAGGATVLLSLDRRLGPLPGALFVMLCLPVGRGSEVGLPRITADDIPIRAHDLVPVVGVALAVPAVVRRLLTRPSPIRWRACVPVAMFGAIGLLALAVGVLGDQSARDIVRDARWWAFYGVGLLALLAGTSRPSVERALLWGLTIYSAIILIGLLMPLFHGGLKYGAYAYDPRLRLHYGQAILLLPALALAIDRFVRRPAWPFGALIALFGSAVAVTLTRTLLLGAVAVVTLTAAWAGYEVARRLAAGVRVRAIATRALPAVAVTLIGIGVGFGVYQAGVRIWTPDWAYSETTVVRGAPTESRPVRPSIGRVFDDTSNAGFGAQAGGRLTSYAIAFVDTAESPVVGGGIGQLAEIPWAWGGFRAHTAGAQPGVDNAYLTVGLKAGALGIAAFAAMVLWPLRQVMSPGLRRLRSWYAPAWLAILGLTLIQSFAVSGYAPYALSLIVVLPALGAGLARRSR